MNMRNMSEAEARGRGLGRLTTPYKLPQEQGMLDNVVADMVRGGINYALVAAKGGGTEVWRSGIRTDERERE
jgi:hypothetical protein